jgi:hypothetical protein
MGTPHNDRVMVADARSSRAAAATAASGDAPGSTLVERVRLKPAVDGIQGIVDSDVHHRVHA